MAFQTWEQVQARPDYQSLDDAGKAATRSNWEKAAASKGVAVQPEQPAQQATPQQAPKEDSSVLSDIGSKVGRFAQGAVAGVGRGLGHGVGGTVEAIENTLGTGTTYGKRMIQNTDQQYDRDLKESGEAGGYGAKVGGAAADVGAMVAAPSVAIPAIAAREFGSAYANQKDDEKNLLTAGLVGGANYYAGKLIPGAGGEAAESILKNALGNVGRNAVAGAKGGAAVGASQALAQNSDADVADIVGGAAEGGATGAAFGGAIGGVHSALGAMGRRSANAAERANPETPASPETPSPQASDITAQADAFRNAATPQEQADALKSGGMYRSVRGSSALESRGIPLTDARLGYSQDAMTAHGKDLAAVQASRDVAREGATDTMVPYLTPREAAGKTAVAKSQWETGGRQLVNDVRGSLDSGSTSIKTFKDQVQQDMDNNASTVTPAEKRANTELMANINKFQKDYSTYKSEMNNVSSGESVKTDNLFDSAARAKESYDNLPDYMKDQFNSDFKDIGDGFAKGFDPLDHAGTYSDAFNQLKEMHPAFRNATTAPSKGADLNLKITDPIGAAKTALNMFRGKSARSKMVAEQEANAGQARQLAAGLASKERLARNQVDDSRAAMENPVVDDGTQGKMEFSNEAAPAAPEVSQETPKASPDQTIARVETPLQRYTRQRAEAEALQNQAAEPAPEAPQPTPDQGLVGQPTRMKEAPEEAPVAPEPTPEPAQEPIPVDTTFNREQARQVFKRTMGREPTPAETAEAEAAQREAVTQQARERMDQVSNFAREAKKPVQEEPPVAEPAPVEAPTEPVAEVKPSPEQALVRTPKAPETPAEAAPEPVVETPSPKAEPKDVSTLEKHKADRVKRAVNIVKNMFSSKKVQDKVTDSNYNNQNVIQRLKREDVAENTQQLEHAAEQAYIAKNKREGKQHELNVAELERWGKAEGVDQSLITKAIEQKGLQKSRILGVNDIKMRATKLHVESLKPKETQQAAETATKEIEPWTSQRDKFYDEVGKMSPDVRAKSMQYIEQAFKASQKTDRPLTDSDVHGLWNKIYNHQADVLSKAQKLEEAAAAKAKAEKSKADQEKIATAKSNFQKIQAEQAAQNSKVKEREQLNDQMGEIQNQMVKHLTEAKVPKSDIDSFVDSYMDQRYGVLDQPMTNVKYNSHRESAIDAAKKFGKEHSKMNAAEKEEALGGQETPETAASKKIFNEVKESVGKSEVNKVEVEDHIADELIDRSEKAFRDGDASAVEKAADDLIKAYGLDDVTGYSLRRYPRIVAKAQTMKEHYPNNPETWLTQTDVDSLAKAGRVNADGMKAKITDTVIGKRYDSVKLLTEREAEAVRKRLDAGEDIKVKIDKGRRGALEQANEQVAKQKVKVTIKRNVSRANISNLPVKRGSTTTPKPEAESSTKVESPKPKEHQYQIDERNQKVIDAARKAYDPNTHTPIGQVVDKLASGLDEGQLTSLIKAIGKAKQANRNASPGSNNYLSNLSMYVNKMRDSVRKGK